MLPNFDILLLQPCLFTSNGYYPLLTLCWRFWFPHPQRKSCWERMSFSHSFDDDGFLQWCFLFTYIGWIFLSHWKKWSHSANALMTHNYHHCKTFSHLGKWLHLHDDSHILPNSVLEWFHTTPGSSNSWLLGKFNILAWYTWLITCEDINNHHVSFNHNFAHRREIFLVEYLIQFC